MKKNELKRVADDYAKLLPSEWRRVQNDFMRRRGSWIQIIAFQPSRWASEYNPMSSLDFLRKPGEIVGGLAAVSLSTARHRVQRWITMREHEASILSVFDDMKKQFRPAIYDPLNEDEILRLLEERLAYWPNAYALCVTACARGDLAKAQDYFAAFEAATARKPYPEIETRRQEIRDILAMIGSGNLQTHFAQVEGEKLSQLPSGIFDIVQP